MTDTVQIRRVKGGTVCTVDVEKGATMTDGPAWEYVHPVKRRAVKAEGPKVADAGDGDGD